MSASLVAKSNGTQGALAVNGTEVVVFDSTGIISGANNMTIGTAQDASPNTLVDFTSIPAWVKRITVMFNGISTNGTSVPIVQIGAGSITNTGYVSTAIYTGPTTAGAAYTAGFNLWPGIGASDTYYGVLTLTSFGSNKWMASGMANRADQYALFSSGYVSLGGTLDRIRFTTTNGTDTFDAGSVNILYE